MQAGLSGNCCHPLYHALPSGTKMAASSRTRDQRQIPPLVALLRLDLVEDIEGVLQWHPPHAAEARLQRELPQLSFRQPHGAKPLAMTGERGGHAIEHADTIEQAPQRSCIALQVLCAVDVQAHIPSIRAQRL